MNNCHVCVKSVEMPPECIELAQRKHTTGFSCAKQGLRHWSADCLFNILQHFPLAICIRSASKICRKRQICRNVPKPIKDSFAVILSSRLWIIWFSTCCYCCLAKDKVCSSDCRVALVQINRWAERRKKIVCFTREAPKGVCIDLRTNHTSVCSGWRAEGDYSWAYGWQAEGKLSVVAETPATSGLCRGAHHPFREQCLIDQLTRMSKY